MISTYCLSHWILCTYIVAADTVAVAIASGFLGWCDGCQSHTDHEKDGGELEMHFDWCVGFVVFD